MTSLGRRGGTGDKAQMETSYSPLRGHLRLVKYLYQGQTRALFVLAVFAWVMVILTVVALSFMM